MKPGWELKKLGEVCDKASSNVSQNQLTNEDGVYPIYGASGFIKNVSFYHQDKEYVSIIKDGAGIGRITLLPSYSSIIGTMQYLIPKDILDIRYFYYFLSSINFLKYKNGSTIPHIYFKDYSDEPILVPPLSEQQRIAAILNEAFVSIAKAKANAEQNLKNARQLFENYLHRLFLQIFHSNEKKTISSLATVTGGYSFKSTDFKKEGRYQVIRMGNIRPGIIREEENPVFIDRIDPQVLRRAQIQLNDVLITQTGTKKKRDYGYTTLVEKENYLLNQRIASIRFSGKYNPKFFLYFSWTDSFKDQFFANETGTVGQGNVGIGAITDALIPFLSLSDQHSIVQKLDALSAETLKLEAIYRQKINNLEELNKSVLRKAFNGDLKTI